MEDLDAGAGRELQAAQPEARRARLDERLLQVAAVAEPDLGDGHAAERASAEAGRERRAGEIEARLGEWEADVVRPLDQPDDALDAEPAHAERRAGAQSPAVGERLLDEHLVATRREVVAGDDGVPPAAARSDDLGDRVVAPMMTGADPDAGRLAARRIGGDVRQREDAPRDLSPWLGSEADDQIGEMGGAGRPREPEAETVRHDDRRRQHRGGEADPERGEERVAPADGELPPGLREQLGER